jgi:hypothetical protein
LILQQPRQPPQGSLKGLAQPPALRNNPILIAAREQIALVESYRLLQSLPSQGSITAVSILPRIQGLIGATEGLLEMSHINLERCLGTPLQYIPIHAQEMVRVGQILAQAIQQVAQIGQSLSLW